MLKLKQYIVTDSIIEKLSGENIPESVLTKLETLKDMRFRSPKDFREALRKEFSKKELDRYGLLIIDKALDYRIRNKIQITISDKEREPGPGYIQGMRHL